MGQQETTINITARKSDPFSRMNNGFSKVSPLLLFSGMLFSVVAIGILDYASSPRMSFAVFYLSSVGVAGWVLGRVPALILGFLCVVISVVGDLFAIWAGDSILFPLWNGVTALLFYVVVIELTARLRTSTRELEARVAERTLALRQEIHERRRLEREVLEVSAREQERIGQDIHDGLCQHLTAASLAAKVLAERLSSTHAPEAQNAHKVVSLVQDGITLSRNVAKGLHPVSMASSGLMQALEELAETSSHLFRIPCRFVCDSPVMMINHTFATHLYRIAREAVNNAMKHSGASDIEIALEPVDDGYLLSVRDNGIGLEPEKTACSGLGLRMMEHRAELIGASLIIRSAMPGTWIECRFLDTLEGAAL